jgi:hypothetical protein
MAAVWLRFGSETPARWRGTLAPLLLGFGLVPAAWLVATLAAAGPRPAGGAIRPAEVLRTE